MNRSATHARFRQALLATALVTTVALTTACAGRLSGVVDFDQERDFSAVKTLAFYEDAYPMERKQDEVRQAIRATIEQQLREKGFGFGRTGEADLLIVYHSGQRTKMHFGGAMRSDELEASLSIAFQDPVTRRSAWYGTVEQTWSGREDVNERIETAVRVLLEKFPPEGSGEIRVREVGR